MICATCGGSVTWRGPISSLTHTECANCGAVNNQIAELDKPDGDAGEAWDTEGGE